MIIRNLVYLKYGFSLLLYKLCDELGEKKKVERWRKKSPEEQHHTALKGFKVDQVIQGASLPDMTEHSHADDCVDESDKKKESANVEKRRQRHDQRKQ